jgi:hypothetical protein
MGLEGFLEQWKKSRNKSTRIPTGSNIQEYKRKADHDLSQEMALKFSLFTREMAAKALNKYASGDNHINPKSNLAAERCRKLGIAYPDIQRIVADEINRVYLSPAAVEKLAEYFRKKGIIGDYKREELLEALVRAASENFF